MNNELLKNLDKLHTTELGIVRIKRNLSLETDDAVEWCRKQINSPNAVIAKKGKLVCQCERLYYYGKRLQLHNYHRTFGIIKEKE